jgi:hypothetical protein
LISLSPLPSAHPSCFQPTLVRASTRCYPRFTLAKGRSPRFASIPSDCNAPFGLAFAAARFRLTSPLRITSRLIMQKARGQAFQAEAWHSPPTACRHTVSGTISLPSQGFFSPFPHGTGSLSVAREYLALPDGPGGFPRDFSCPAVLRCLSNEPGGCRLRGCHPLWPPVPGRSTNQLVFDSPALRPDRSYNPSVQARRFGLFRVRSPLLAESLLFSVPAGTEMVHFPALSSPGLWIQPGILRDKPEGVSPFGYLRVEACLRLTEAFRSLPRPSSTSGAKAFTVCP